MQSDDRYRVHLDVEAGRSSRDAAAADDRVFRILLLGEFTGASTAADAPLRAIEVDRDNVDDLMAAFRPSVRFRLGTEGGPEVVAEFECLGDFHPDHLLHRVPLLDALRELRQRARDGVLDLQDPLPASAADADGVTGTPAPPASAEGRGSDGLLDQILDETAGPPRPQAGPAPSQSAPASAAAPEPSDLRAFIESVLAPHRVREADPRQAALTVQVEETMVSVLRAILHHPAFQALESAWRGVDMLVRRLETGTQLKVYLLDIPGARLIAELTGEGDNTGSALHRAIVGAREQGTPWSVLSYLFTFDATTDDLALLERAGALARDAGAACIAAASPLLAGVASFATEQDGIEPGFLDMPAWDALRGSDVARHIGLVLPRLLLRAPYDPREEPCEEIELEEMTSPPAHEDYLWGNPALVGALLLGRSFVDDGWRMRPDGALEIRGLPLHLYRRDGETVAKPCAEALLTDRVALRIMHAGLMPLLSQKNGDAVRLAGFQSIAEPASPLVGPWSDTSRR
jgi:type VI secretion system protein ImpC